MKSGKKRAKAFDRAMDELLGISVKPVYFRGRKVEPRIATPDDATLIKALLADIKKPLKVRS